MNKRRKGEYVTLHCTRCSWGTELPMAETAASTVVPCTHCGEALYWHLCPTCGLGYLGASVPLCPSCDSPELDELTTS